MTESLIPYDDVEDDRDEPRVRRSVLLAGAAAVAVGAAAAVLVVGGNEQSAEQLVPLSAVVRAPQAQPAAAAPAAAGPAAGTVLKLPAQHDEDIARNPFEARYVEPPPSVAPPAPAAPPGPAQPGAPVGTLPLPVPLPPLPLPGADTPAPKPAQPVEPVPVEYPITLEAVGQPQGEVRLVTWTIDGKPVQVVPGQRFGRFGELVVLAYLLEGDVASGVLLQVGDANPLSVAVKETIKVL